MSKILIIEDDHDIAELVSIHMIDTGFKTEKVHDGKEGLIILDLKLPGMDGLEICRKSGWKRSIRPSLCSPPSQKRSIGCWDWKSGPMIT